MSFLRFALKEAKTMFSWSGRRTEVDDRDVGVVGVLLELVRTAGSTRFVVGEVLVVVDGKVGILVVLLERVSKVREAKEVDSGAEFREVPIIELGLKYGFDIGVFNFLRIV
ncbi:hypothetical protein PIB30_026882 [Stylosanthes scabra]|uniref:Uncharacterized protein n=1 Tax=Stylosanthes scabra TaxID=79078 RepID=A0ABU6UBH3_9FABA|nr:hypothetical protein [Stylosanthes scabra]